MAAVTTSIESRTVTSKDAQRKWKEVTDRALREPVVITAHGRPRHVLMAYEDYEQFRRQERQAYTIADIPPDLAAAILADLDNLRAPIGTPHDGDTIID
jgi:prevent-host-death family protein